MEKILEAEDRLTKIEEESFNMADRILRCDQKILEDVAAKNVAWTAVLQVPRTETTDSFGVDFNLGSLENPMGDPGKSTSQNTKRHRDDDLVPSAVSFEGFKKPNLV